MPRRRHYRDGRETIELEIGRPRPTTSGGVCGDVEIPHMVEGGVRCQRRPEGDIGGHRWMGSVESRIPWGIGRFGHIGMLHVLYSSRLVSVVFGKSSMYLALALRDDEWI